MMRGRLRDNLTLYENAVAAKKKQAAKEQLQNSAVAREDRQRDTISRWLSLKQKQVNNLENMKRDGEANFSLIVNEQIRRMFTNDIQQAIDTTDQLIREIGQYQIGAQYDGFMFRRDALTEKLGELRAGFLTNKEIVRVKEVQQNAPQQQHRQNVGRPQGQHNRPDQRAQNYQPIRMQAGGYYAPVLHHNVGNHHYGQGVY